MLIRQLPVEQLQLPESWQYTPANEYTTTNIMKRSPIVTELTFFYYIGQIKTPNKVAPLLYLGVKTFADHLSKPL
ncbi:MULTISPECIES: hypothetical protein [Pseudanabaena]|uniref:hypothetical protein n=1 Tax=Pseudanabaena TaxID=1152 RepID=UPI00247AF641|nr:MULTISPECIES: hypothetical protein [Pseudanabaena]MEA5486405.1 hypothetical protein [Pseudanabaena sp. CCNP1317]WGS71448.1 hypothetical protein OA858_17275 [Pseudanabaena galeata CCNP1313]